MKQTIFKPNYQQGLVNLSNSILKHYGLTTHHSTLSELDDVLATHSYQTICLLVLDGMGMDMLEHNLPENSFLRSHIKMPISSVYPPTTTAATTSIYSGLTPQEHGYAGWQCYFKEYDCCVELFRNLDYYTQEKLSGSVIDDFLSYEKLFEQVEKSGTAKGYGIAQPWGNFEIKDFDDICNHISELSHKKEKKFILSYWRQPDSVMHKTGCYSQETKETISSLNDKLEKMAKKLEDTLLIVTADHGLLDIAKSVNLNEIKEIDNCLRLPPAVEPRTTVFYLKPECEETFIKEFNRHFGDEYLLMSSAEYMKEGYLGEGQEHPKLREFLGDYVALAVGDTIIQYQTKNGVEPENFKGHHAGLSAKEMLVPLIIYTHT